MKKIFLILISIFVFSCGEHEDVIYDNHNGQTIAYFKQLSKDLPVEINGSGYTDVVVGVSTLSDTDRTVTVSIDSDNTTMDSTLFHLASSTAVIPANEYHAIFTVYADYSSILDSENRKIVLKLDSVDGARIDSKNTISLNVFRFCPVPETFFTGNYLIEQVSPFIDGPTLSDGTIVSVTAQGTKRIFSTQNYPNYCAPTMDFSFNLNCNNIIVDVLDSVCSCGDGTAWFGPALGSNATYDITAGDSIMYVTFADDVQQNCGPTVDTTYKFTKQ